MGGVVKYADLGAELNKALWRLFRKALRISFKDPYQTYPKSAEDYGREPVGESVPCAGV
jgi:hypothetical protein